VDECKPLPAAGSLHARHAPLHILHLPRHLLPRVGPRQKLPKKSGWAVQVVPRLTPGLTALGFCALKLKHDELLSNFALKLNMRRGIKRAAFKSRNEGRRMCSSTF
jgi:hypothetical protein